MGRVANFKALGEFAFLPAVSITSMVTRALREAAEAEREGDLIEAEDLFDWAMFLDTEMAL